MPHSTQTIRPERAKDRFAFLMHATALAGVFGAVSFIVAAPVVSGLAIGLTLLSNEIIKPKLIEAFQKSLPTPVDPDKDTFDACDTDADAEDCKREKQAWLSRFVRVNPLQAARMVQTKAGRKKEITRIFNKVAQLTQKAGIGMKPDLHILSDGAFITKEQIEAEKDKDKRSRLILRKAFGRHANAFALEHNDRHVLLTDKLIERLTPDEIDAVVAHEIGHIAGQHFDKKDRLAILSGAAVWTARLNAAFTIISSVKNAGLVAIGIGLGQVAGFAYQKAAKLDLRNNAQDLQDYNAMVKSASGLSMMALGLMFMAPDLTVAIGLNYLTGQLDKLTQLSFSRRNEFQADRIAAELTEKPQALASALDKIRDYNYSMIASAPEQRKHEKRKQGGPLSRLFSRLGDLYKTHPNIERRREHLEKIQNNLQAPAPT